MNSKIAIIGAGKVGTEAANAILRMHIGDCVLIDRNESAARGKSLDLVHSTPLRCSSVSVSGGSDYRMISGAQVVIITAGKARTPGMSRDDLLEANINVIQQVLPPALEHAAHDAVLIIVTNPLDAMTYAAWKLSGKPREKVIGMAGILDSARFSAAIANELDISTEDVQAMVLGSHGDLMVPLCRYATVAGIRVEELMDEEAMRRVVEKTRNAGTELVGLLKDGSAYYAAGMSVAVMADAIVHDKRKVFCCSVRCQGEYDLDGTFIGIPVVLGNGGMQRIIRLRLTPDEQTALNTSAGHLRQLQKSVDAVLSVQ